MSTEFAASMSSRANRSYARAAVTHDELRPLLPAYAAGALDEIASEAIRDHLAGGCVDCLQDVFARPFALSLSAEREVSAAWRAALSGRRGLVAAVVVLALALGAVVAWMIVELRAREAAARGEAERVEARLVESRLAAAERERADLAARIAAIESQLAGAEERATREAEAARAAAEESTRAQSELALANERVATLQRGLRRREAELERLRLGAAGRGLGADPLASPEAEMLALAPIAPFRDVRGHVVWNPAGETGLVYAFHLPALVAGASYRVRVVLDDDRELAGRPFRVDGTGEAVIALPTDGSRGRPHRVQVVLEPGGRPVLGWERASAP